MYDPHYKYTVEEYWQLTDLSLDQKYEYIEGQIRMMTGGSPAHGQLANRIGGMLDAALRDTDCNVYSSDVALALANFRSYYPDVSVSCDPADWTRRRAIEAPSVVVEVLSPTTETIDRNEKLLAYQHYPTIQEILLVDSRRCLIEHHHRTGPFTWPHRIFTHRDNVIELPAIDVSLSVKDIYFKVYLEFEELS
jgi:Uma2 family endonuclease